MDSDIKCSESENIICAEYIVWGQSQNAVNHSTIESITSDVLHCNITHQLFNQNFFIAMKQSNNKLGVQPNSQLQWYPHNMLLYHDQFWTFSN